LKENNIGLRRQTIYWKFATGCLLLVLTLWLASDLLDLTGTVMAVWALPNQTLLVLFLLGAASWLLRGLRTWILFEHIPLNEALGMSFVHNTANNLAPMRLGELALPFLARWLGRIEFSVGLTGLVWIRLLDLVSLIGIATCILLLPVFGLPMLALLAGLIFLTPLLMRWVLPKMQRVTLPSLLHQARAQLIYESTQPARLHRLWRLTVLAWLSKLLGMAVLLAALSGLSLAEVMATILGAELSSILPIHGLAGAGSYQAGGVLGATLTGQNALTGLELAIQLHVYVLSLTLVFGILGTLLLTKRTFHG